MGLIAWYPFNGDTLDYSGNSGLLTASGTPTAETAGKIGGTIDFSTGYYTTSSANLDLHLNLTITFWVKLDSLPASRFGIMETAYGAEIALNVGVDGHLEWYYGTSGTTTTPYTAFNTDAGVVEVGNWVHIALVRNIAENKVYYYKNGVQILDGTLAYLPTPFYADVLKIGNSYTGNLIGNLNDVRFYDDVLSDKEIQEIAKAKILHYTFNDFKEPTTNIGSRTWVSAWNNTGTATWNYDDAIPGNPYPNEAIWSIHKDTDGNSALLLNYVTTAPSTSYTLSTWFWQERGGGGNVPYIRQYPANSNAGNLKWVGNDSGDWDTWPQSRWIRLEGTFTSAANATYAVISSYINITGDKIAYVGWQGEEKDHATPFTPSSRTGTVSDATGFKNNAPLVEATSPEWISGRIGSGAYKFNGSTSVIARDMLSVLGLQSFTVNFWAYFDTTGVRDVIFGNYDATNDFNIEKYTNDNIRFYWNGVNIYSSTNSLPIGEWCMVTVIRDKENSLVKMFVNGSSVYNASHTLSDLTSLNGTLRLGRDVRTTTEAMAGKLDDVRVYTTALSDTDILELAQTRAQLDNTGNLMLNEITTNGVNADFTNLVQYQYWEIGDYNSNVTWNTGLGDMTVQATANVTNRVEISSNPIGNDDIMYNFYVDTTYYTQYSHPTSYYYFNIDPTKTYRFSQWIYLHKTPGTSTNQRNYLGILANTVCNINTTTLNSNPYFTSPSMGDANYMEKWALQVFYVYPATTTGNPTTGTLYYVDGTSATDGVNYTWAAATTSSYIRQYHMYQYAECSADSYVKLYRPRMEVVDGNEPSIQELINCSAHRPLVNSDGDEVWNLKNLTETGIGNYGEVSEVGITDGLVGYWKLNTDAKDYSGNGYDGTVVGATLTSGLKNGAYEFAYTTDQINIGASSPPPTNNFTLSAWVYSNDITKSQNIISKNGPYFMRIVGSKLRFDIYTSSWLFQNGTATLLTDTWYFLTATYDGAYWKGFINGNQDFSTAKTGTVTSDGYLRIGYTTGGEDSPMDGKIADVRIYNRALSIEEINILYKYGLPTTGMQLTTNGTLFLNKEIIEVL